MALAMFASISMETAAMANARPISPNASPQSTQRGERGRRFVDEYRVEANGSLTPIGSVTVPDAVGGEGIAVA